MSPKVSALSNMVFSLGVIAVPSPPRSSAQCQLLKVVGDDSFPTLSLGRAVALDQGVLVVGTARPAPAVSAALVFRHMALHWSLETLLTPTDGRREDVFGWSTAVRGATVVVGAPWTINDPEIEGAVYVFERQTESPWLETARLLGAPNDHDPSRYEYFGWSVALDGPTLAIGATDDYDDNGLRKGALYVFERDPNGVWRQADRLLGDGGNFGASVAIHDGVIVVGAPEDDPLGFSSGSAYVFELDGAGDWIETAKLIPSDHGFLDSFGLSVATDAATILIGAYHAPDGDTAPGAVYVFEPDQGLLRDPARGLPSDTAGGPPTGQWIEIQKLTPPDGQNSDFFGVSVALDGELALVGAENYELDGTNMGAAFVYQRQPDRLWRLVGLLRADDPQREAEFGRSVALSGNLAVVGAPFHDVVDSDGNTQVDAGVAYVFAVGPDRDDNGVMDVCECRAAVEFASASSAGAGGPQPSRDRQGATRPGETPGPPHDRRDREGAVFGPQTSAAGGFVASPDLDLDRRVGMGDLLILLANFGRDRDNPPAGHSPPYAALHEYGDLDLDQAIDLHDLALMLAAYDRACE